MEFLNLGRLKDFLTINQSYLNKIRQLKPQLVNFYQTNRIAIYSSLTRCYLCGCPSLQPVAICATCLDDLPKFNHRQLKENFLYWPAFNQLFAKRYFDVLQCYAPYIWPYNIWLKQLKYSYHFEISKLLGYLLSQRWQQTITANKRCQNPENVVVLSVPIHISKWQERGFNQAHLIAKEFAQRNQLNYQPALLTRVKTSSSQVGQSGAQRRKNLTGAFALTKALTNDTTEFILVDDVITTGTTVNEISRLLKRHGAKTITVVTFAISLPNNTKH